MSIAISVPLAFVNNQLHRSETDIGTQMKAVLRTISAAMLYKKTVSNLAIASQDTALALPADVIDIDELVLNDGASDGKPLTRISVSEYRLARQNTSADYNEPQEFAVRINAAGNTLFLFPASNGSYTGKYEYFAWYNYDGTSEIELPAHFTELINYGAAYEVAVKYGLERYIQIWGAKYGAELESMKVSIIDDSPCISRG